jgi:Spirocyclase AveC-like
MFERDIGRAVDLLTVTEAGRLRSAPGQAQLEPVTPPIASRPVVWWALLGAAFVALAAYIHLSWIISGDATHVGTGPTPVPSYMSIAAHAQEVIFGILIVVLAYALVIRPRIREGRIGFDGLLFLAMFTVWWQDPLYNYVSTGFTYNSAFLNLGGWAGHVPGWSSPNPQKFAEPLIWDVSFYVVVSVLAIIYVSRLMSWAQRRWPALTTGKLLVGLFCGLVVADFVLEFAWVLAGSYSYAGTIGSLTIFPSHYFRFPLYESLLAAMLFMGWIPLYHFRNDKGERLIERGIDRVRAGAGGKNLIRFLALAGALNLVFLVFNNVWVNAFQLHAGTWPRTLQERSYFTHGMCGEGTSYQCGGTNISLPRGGNEIHIGREGRVVAPPGAVQPEPVELQK